MVGRKASLKAIGWTSGAGEQYEMVGDSELPKHPTPVVISDKKGRAKWTVSIPPNAGFPLKPQQYSDICLHNRAVSMHVADLHRHMGSEHAAHFDYYHVDQYFMDVEEAVARGLLPGISATGMMSGVNSGLPACEKTMTFVLETSDAGLGNGLMQLWTAYGLAKKEGRDFFIDDTRWVYGKYSTFFQPPPIPNCRPPPRHEMLPCPHHARHLVVSAATVAYTFGGQFNEHFEDPKKMEVFRQQPIFALARTGFEALFHLQSVDANYLNSRLAEFAKKTTMDNNMGRGLTIGMHIRHGDRRPYEFQYKDSYIPNDLYIDEAREQLYKTFETSGKNGTEDLMSEMKSIFIVASDDPDVYTTTEFSHAMRAQEHISLASKSNTKTPSKPLPSPRKFVEEGVGWEGGFFAGMFWSLGKPLGSPSTSLKEIDTSKPPSPEALKLRELIGRAYLLDLAILGRSDRIVCTVSSMACRLLAIMMGWENAFVKDHWKNVDGAFEWRGIEW